VELGPTDRRPCDAADPRRRLRPLPERPGHPGPHGEFLPFQLSRLDSRYKVLDFKRPLEKLPSEYFRTNIAVTTTGVFSHATLIAAIQEVGVDNLMFSIDYPFESTEKRSSSSEPRRWLPLTKREWRT
jgi:hypothetical protein